MRVVSLFPGATETIAALGAEHLLVGISHECDYPATIQKLPRVTRTSIDSALGSGAIDRAVRSARAAGRPVIAVDAEALERLDPDLIVTQGLCDVCAVAEGQAFTIAQRLGGRARVLSLEGRDLQGVLDDVRRLGAALDRPEEADELALGMRYRLARLRRGAPDATPRVLCVEWLDPLYLAGHWVPDLVAAAGGVDAGASPGEHSRQVPPAALARLRPDLAIVMLCGFGIERARTELEAAPLPALGVPVWALDGNAYTSRPGPRLPDGARRIQAAMLGRELPGLVRLAP